MYKRSIQSLSWVLVLTVVSNYFVDAIVYGKYFSNGTGSNGSLSSSDPNESQPAQVGSIPIPVSYPGLRRNAFDIGPDVYSFHYEEPGVMEEEGFFYGLRLGYTSRNWVAKSQQTKPLDGGMMMRTEARFAYGQVDYDGYYYDFTTGSRTPITINNIDDWAFEARFLLGGDLLAKSTLNTLYGGIGYRYLNDDFSFAPGGYERESNYFYIPVGYQFDSSSELGWSVGFNVEFDIFIMGIQRSHFSDIGLKDIDNRQDSGYGYRVSFRLQHKSKGGILILEPYFRYWDIDKSEIEYEFGTTWWEPANETEEIGLSVIWMF